MALSLIARNMSRIQGATDSYKLLKTVPSLNCYSAKFTLNTSSNKNWIIGNKATILQSQPTIINLVKGRSMSSDHSGLWKLEKLVTATLLGVVPATFLLSSPILDNVFAVMVAAHTHWGLEAIAQDYVRPIIFGNVIPKIAIALVYFISALTLGGLLYFNQNDIGIGNAVCKLWSIRSQKN